MLFKFFFLFFLLFFCTNLFAKDGSAIALMYHRFDENKYPSTSISQKNFHSQLLYLKENNFNVLPITSLIDFFYHNKPLPEKSVFITVDDAYTSFYKFAFPVLKKFNFPFSIFLSTDFISKDGKNDFMNLEMLREIKDNNGEIYNHSHKHQSFIKRPLEEVEKDILKADKIIKENLGGFKKIISYPYGESNKSVEQLIQKLGYKIGFSQHSSPIHFDENKFNLPRFSINDEYGELKRFKQIVNVKPLNFSFFEIKKKQEHNSTLEINFKSNFNLKNINCFISDGILKKEINDNFIRLELSKLSKNKRYRLNCTTLKNKNIYWFGKMIIKEKGEFLY